MFKALGRIIIKFFTQLGQAASLVSSCVFWLFKSPLEFNQTMQQTTKIGVESMVVATLTSLFTGMVLALQAGTTMQSILSEPLYIGTIVGFKDNLFEVKISENTKITILANGIVDVFQENNGVSKK